MGKKNRSRKRGGSRASNITEKQDNDDRPASANSTEVSPPADIPLASASAPATPLYTQQPSDDKEDAKLEVEAPPTQDEEQPASSAPVTTPEALNETPAEAPAQVVAEAEPQEPEQVQEQTQVEESAPAKSGEDVVVSTEATDSTVTDKSKTQAEETPVVAEELVGQLSQEVTSKLANQFKRRSSLDALKDKGIYHGQVLHDADGKPYAGVADTLHSAAIALEKERNKGHLEFLLDTRPPIDTLSSANIVEPTQVASSLQPTRKHLDMAMRRDSLKHSLQARPQIGAAEHEKWFQPTATQVPVPPNNRAFRRVLMSISLKVLAQLHTHAFISDSVRGAMKELVFNDDERLVGAVQIYARTEDAVELLTTFRNIADSLGEVDSV